MSDHWFNNRPTLQLSMAAIKAGLAMLYVRPRGISGLDRPDDAVYHAGFGDSADPLRQRMWFMTPSGDFIRAMDRWVHDFAWHGADWGCAPVVQGLSGLEREDSIEYHVGFGCDIRGAPRIMDHLMHIQRWYGPGTGFERYIWGSDAETDPGEA